MTREEALRRLTNSDPVGYQEADEIFRAFGFLSLTPNWKTEVYYHPTWKTCGMFTAQDDGLHHFTDGQVDLMRRMVQCITFCEQATRSPLATTEEG